MAAYRAAPGTIAPRSRSRQKVLDAAMQAFSRRGFHETRMDDIARLAGVAKGTLYYNFPSKTDLFAALVSEGMDRFLQTLDREVVSDLPFPDHFRRLVGVQVDLLLEWSDLFVVAGGPGTQGADAGTTGPIEAARDRYVGYIAGMIRQGQRLGYLRASDPDIVAAQMLGLMDGLVRLHRRSPVPIPRQRMIDELHTLLALGLLAPRPGTPSRDAAEAPGTAKAAGARSGRTGSGGAGSRKRATGTSLPGTGSSRRSG